MLDEFIETVRTATAGPTDASGDLDVIVPAMQALAADRSWLPDSAYATDDAQGFGIMILHEEPADGFLLETVCWQPGRGVAPHDHQTWGVVVGLDGEELNVDWRRMDDGGTPGRAALEVACETLITRGSVKILSPDDVHSIRNESNGLSLSLHLYGRSLAKVDRSEFDPITGTVRACPKRVRRR